MKKKLFPFYIRKGREDYIRKMQYNNNTKIYKKGQIVIKKKIQTIKNKQ